MEEGPRGPGSSHSDDDFETENWRNFLPVDFGLSEHWSFFAEASYVAIDSKAPDGSFSTDGFGDSRLLARYTFMALPHVHEEGETGGPLGLHFGDGRLALGAGVSIPTGEPEPFVPSDEPVPNSALQTGTGTWDPLFTAVWSQSVETGSAFAGLGVRIPGGENQFDYRTGEAFQLNLGAVVPVTDNFDFVPKLSWLYTEPDEFQGEDTFATGGHVVSIVPGVRIGLAENVDQEAAVEIPVFRDLRTESLQAAARFSAGITVSFWDRGALRVRTAPPPRSHAVRGGLASAALPLRKPPPERAAPASRL